MGNKDIPSAKEKTEQPLSSQTRAELDALAQTCTVEECCDENDRLFGHCSYEEVSADLLKPFPGYSGFLVHQDMLPDLRDMLRDAITAGVELIPRSAFRSVADQVDVFYNLMIERDQTSRERAHASAPPGRSEHHTGFAVDFNEVEATFPTNQPTVFQWLKDNAATYNFEMSFPEGNEQGIDYEPWHWRWVGNENARRALHLCDEDGEKGE